MWQVQVKCDNGTKIEMLIASEGSALWDLMQLLMRYCTDKTMSQMTIEIKRK